MRRFRFSLERLLTLRGHAERAARRQLAEAIAELSALEASFAGIEQSIHNCRQEERLVQSRSLLEALLRGLEKSRANVERSMEQARQRVEQERLNYQHRRQEAQALQNLRDQRYEVWRQEVEAAEQADLDELSRSRFLRQRRAKVEVRR